MRDWVDFSAVKQAVRLEAVLRHYQVPGLRKSRHQLVLSDSPSNLAARDACDTR
jgi:hypothetical protein